MTSSENLTSFVPYDPWMFQPTAAYPDSWQTEAFARDAETLTRALQKTISSNNNSDAVLTSSDAVSSFQHTPTASGSDPEMAATATRRRAPAKAAKETARTGGVPKKITKRKPRATKKCQTTFIIADPANFRQKVQEVTGVRFETLQHQLQNQQLIVKPEPKRLTGAGAGLALPTLDSSSFFVDHYLNGQQQQQEGGGGVGVGQLEGSLTDVGDGVGQMAYGESLIGGGGPGYGYESYQSFPTLESWKVMCDF